MHSLGREEEGIRLPDGTFFGSLMVFHHLHCLVSEGFDHFSSGLDENRH